MTEPLRELFARYKVEVDNGPLRQAAKAFDLSALKASALTGKLGEIRAAAKRAGEGISARFGGMFARRPGKAPASPVDGTPDAAATKGGKGGKGAPEENAAARIAKLGAYATALGAATYGMRAWVKGTLAESAALTDVADQLGISTAALQQWQTVATQAGASADDIRGIFVKLSKNANEFATTGKGAGAAAFRELGVAAKDASGGVRPAGDILRDLAGALAGMSDETKKTALAAKVLGPAGVKLLPMFRGTREQVLKTIDEMGELGVVYSEQFTRDADAAGDTLALAELQIKALSTGLLSSLLPALVKGAQWFVRISRTIRAFVALNSTRVKASLAIAAAGWLVMSGAIGKVAAAFRALSWAAAKPMLILAAIILIVDDLIVLFNGGDSALGRFLDRMGGAGTAKLAVEAMRLAWRDLVQTMVSLPDDLDYAWKTLKGDWDKLMFSLSDAWDSFTASLRDFVVPDWIEGLIGGGISAPKASGNRGNVANTTNVTINTGGAPVTAATGRQIASATNTSFANAYAGLGGSY